MAPLQSTPDLADRIEALPEYIGRTKRNFRMQYRLARHTLIPWLEARGVLPNPANVIEIGCAEGGVVAAFIERGTNVAAGTDIAGRLLTDISIPIAQKLGLEVTYSEHDVIGEEPLPEWRGAFDVVLLRDVIEHLDDPTAALINIAKLLKPGGVVLLTFPPYTSAFGGHQQLLGTFLGSLPWVHMLPKSWFKGIVRRGDEQNAEEVLRLHRIRLSADAVIESSRKAHLAVIDQRYFFLRPVFRWKYQKPIPTIEMTGLKGVSLARKLAMEVAILLQKPSA
jgi:SAM-dependent methyltransferase